MSSPDSISGTHGDWADYSLGQQETAEAAETATITPSSTDQITSLLNQQEGAIQRKNYQTDAQTPLLEDPGTEEAEQGTERVIAKRPFKRMDRAVILRHFQSEFQKELAEYGNQQSPPLTEEELEKLLRAYENPDDPEVDPEMRALAQQLGNKVAEKIRKQYNLPPTWSPRSLASRDWTPSTDYGTDGIQTRPYPKNQRGDIEEAFNQAVQNGIDRIDVKAYTPPLSAQDLATIRQLAKEPGSVSGELRPEITALAEKIRSEALDSTQGTFSLPSSWAPGTTDRLDWTPITMNGIHPSEKTKAFFDDFLVNSKTHFEDANTIMGNLQTSLPPSHPGQITIKDFMKAIADAIQEFKKFLYEDQAKTESKWVKSFTDERIDAIKKQAEKYEANMELVKEAKEKQKQMDSIKVALYVVAALVAVVGIVAALFTGGTSLFLVVLAVTIISTGITIADSQTGFLSKGMEAVINGLAEMIMALSIGVDVDPEIARITAGIILFVAVITVAVILFAFGGGGGAASAATDVGAQVGLAIAKETAKQIALNVTMTLATTIIGPITTRLVEDIIKKSDPDMDEDKRKLIAMIVALLVALVCGAMTGRTMSQGVSKLKDLNAAKQAASGATEKAATQAAEAAKITEKMMQRAREIWNRFPDNFKDKLFKTMDKAIPTMNIALPASEAAMNIALGAILMQQAEIERERGRNDADIHAMQALIKLLDQLLANMQDTTGAEVKLISSLDNVQKNMYRGASESLQKGWSAVGSAV